MTDLLGPASAPNAVTTRPSDARVFGVSDTWFQGCSAPNVDDGTEIDADYLNGILAQVRNAIRGMGVTQNNADDDMLLKAIQSSAIRYAVDTSGAANTITIANTRPVTVYTDGLAFFVKLANDVTGATTINSDAVGAVAVVHPDGTALARGDWPSGGVGLLVYRGSSFQLISVTGPTQGQEFGQCYLSLSAGNLLLSRWNGRFLMISGIYRQIPSGGVTLSAVGLSSSTLYYIYAYWNGSSIVLEASATGHTADTSTGCEVKSGDTSRTLVGMAYVTGSGFVDTDGQRYVLSWFNRRRKSSKVSALGPFSTASTTPVEISTSLRNSFITWANAAVDYATNGQVFENTSEVVYTRIAFDASLEADVAAAGSGAAGNTFGPACVMGTKNGLSEGQHVASMYGHVSGAATAQWSAPGSVSAGVTVAVTVEG